MLYPFIISRQGATGVPLFTTWDSVAGKGLGTGFQEWWRISRRFIPRGRRLQGGPPPRMLCTL
jgi:hypothetical protein